MDYDFAELDLTDDGDAARARRRGWLTAVLRGFHDPRPSDDFEKLWLEHVRSDQARCYGAWLPAGEFGAGDVPVATLSDLHGTLNTGLGLEPLRMITDVTTSPAHRRRGLVRRLIEQELRDAVDAGYALAALTVSEATIYGRWGFGAATFGRPIEVDTGPRFGLRDFADSGRVEMIDPRESWKVLQPLMERFHAGQRGSTSWPQFYEQFLTGRQRFGDESGPDPKLWGAVHLDAHGQVDGVVTYRFEGKDGTGPTAARKAGIGVLLPATDEALLALWHFLGGLDLVNKVTWHNSPPHDALPWALRDMNCVRYTGEEEFLWVRVLDVPRALAARPWRADGRVVLEVDDAQGHAAGRWALTTDGGRAQVTPTDEAAQVTITAETLGTVYLGPVPLDVLARAGRVRGDRDAVARLGAMADLPDRPWTIAGF